jgi:hypothetical protein
VRISLTPEQVNAATTPANAFYLTERERKLCAKKAAIGDVIAAEKIAKFYLMHHEGLQRTALDDKKCYYWMGVADRLEKASTSKSRRKK